MSAGLPNLLIHQNRRIHAIHVVALIDKPAPPQIHDITLQLHAQRTVIPGTAQTAIHIRPLINKAATLAQADNIFHFCLTHQKTFLHVGNMAIHIISYSIAFLWTILHRRVLPRDQPASTDHLSYPTNLRHIRQRLRLDEPKQFDGVR